MIKQEVFLKMSLVRSLGAAEADFLLEFSDMVPWRCLLSTSGAEQAYRLRARLEGTKGRTRA